MTDEADNLLRRYSDEERLRRYINLLVDRLIDLQNKTNPEMEARSERGKDLAAFHALRCAGEIVEALAGWAIDHQIGLAAEGLEFVPRQPSGTEEHPEYLDALKEVNDHRHEKKGAELLRDRVLDPMVARQLTLNLIKTNPGGFPVNLTKMLEEALKGLPYNDVRPLLAPTAAGRKVSYREQQLQLQAIGFVNYRVGRGLKKFQAIKDVANAYGVGEHTLRGWEPRLREELGSLEVERTISFAKNSASLEGESILEMYQGKERELPSPWEERYGPRALQAAAKQFQAVQAEM
jgi:hypothetical protein